MLMVSGAMQAWIDLKTSRFESRPILEAPTVVPSLDDVAVVGQTIQQRAGHLGIHKDTRLFLDRLSPGEMLPPDPADRLHNNHPHHPLSTRAGRLPVLHPRGSILDAYPPH